MTVAAVRAPRGIDGRPWQSKYLIYMACVNVVHMTKMIQIRNVPDDLHRTLKIRAAQAGMSLSDYLLAEIERVAEKPTLTEMMDRLAKVEPVKVSESPEEIIRRHRDAS